MAATRRPQRSPFAGAVSLKGAVNSIVNRPKKNPPVGAADWAEIGHSPKQNRPLSPGRGNPRNRISPKILNLRSSKLDLLSTNLIAIYARM
jgi:hypothetical protein